VPSRNQPRLPTVFDTTTRGNPIRRDTAGPGIARRDTNRRGLIRRDSTRPRTDSSPAVPPPAMTPR
jgi:hypothetical protein